MTPEEKSELVEAMSAAYESTGQFHVSQIKAAIDNHAKSDDHLFVQSLKEREQRKAEMWQSAKGNVVSYGIIALLGGSLAAAWQVFKTKIGGG